MLSVPECLCALLRELQQQEAIKTPELPLPVPVRLPSECFLTLVCVSALLLMALGEGESEELGGAVLRPARWRGSTRLRRGSEKGPQQQPSPCVVRLTHYTHIIIIIIIIIIMTDRSTLK